MVSNDLNSGPKVSPTKSKDIGSKQLRVIANLTLEDRLRIIAEGLPIILSSMEGLAAASLALGDHPRAAEMLSGSAQEEAAKALILLDYVRCPPNRSDLAHTRLTAFYDHGSRLIYAEACRWIAYDIEMLRGYVDNTRASHYVEGDFGEWIMPNWDVYTREAIMYADLTRQESGILCWNDPLTWETSCAHLLDSLPTIEPVVLRLVRSFGKLGFFQTKALKLINEIWSPHAFVSAESKDLADRLIQSTVAALSEADLVTELAEQSDVDNVYRSWQLPMYAIDVKEREVTLETLQAQQAGQFRSATI